MKNREVFVRDPATAILPNDGVVAVKDAQTAKEIEALRYELEHFVCEGQYQQGMTRILDSYQANTSSASQPAAWVSGFYGSGKSHLLKMLRHLWVNTSFEGDGACARDLAQLPADIRASLKELDAFGKRCGGVHAVGGFLPSGGGRSPRLILLGMLFKSMGLPEALPQAQFCLWLQENGTYEQVRNDVEVALAAKGKSFFDELHNLYVSPVLAQALLDADPTFASDIKQVRSLLREQFPKQDDLPTSEFIRIFRQTLEKDGQLPAALIALDEIQLYIAGNSELSRDIQDTAEALCKQLDSRVLLIGAGQTALAADDPLLERLRDRFTVAVELSDTDVETVIRKVVLAKKADQRSAIESTLEKHRGEIDRQLTGTRIAVRTEDRDTIVDDYPLLPVRRRFWEAALRAVDVPGTSSQLRTQLRMVHEAARDIAEAPLGTVVPADYLFGQQRPALLQNATLLKEIDETIQRLDDGTESGKLAKRICELVYLIRKLPRDEGIDIGVRATAAMLADLLVKDLADDGTRLRKEVPQILTSLEERGVLIALEDGEYSLQTKASSEWNAEYRNQQTRLRASATTTAQKRGALIQARCSELLQKVRLVQGQCKEPRKLSTHFGNDVPDVDSAGIPVWVRDGWGESEATVVADAREAGNESPVIFVYIPKASAEDLQRAILEYAAAQSTLDTKGMPSEREGQEARDAMVGIRNRAEQARGQIVRDIVDTAKVFQGGGNEQLELTFAAKVESAAEASLIRLFPEFHHADDSRWKTVIDRARNGDENALSAINWTGPVDQHRVTSAVLREIGAGRQGKQLRSTFSETPYGWPRDAVDAALIVLHTANHLRASLKGNPIERGQLDQNKIALADFRTESMTLSAKDKMSLRKLFQDAGIDCKANEEAAKAEEYVARLLSLADQIGGEPPLPERPSIQHLLELQSQVGNEQLAAILSQADNLRKSCETWDMQAKLAAERLPAWDEANRLMEYARGLEGAVEIERELAAIRDERRLLEATDPIPPITKRVSDLLRAELSAVQSSYRQARELQEKLLAESELWKQLPKDKQEQALAASALSASPLEDDASDIALLEALNRASLDAWRTKLAALPQQYRNTLALAAKELEPKSHAVKLPGGVLKTEDDLKAWIAKVEAQLRKELEDGPIVIS